MCANMRESMIKRERERRGGRERERERGKMSRGCLKEEKGVRTRSARKRARSSLLAQYKQEREGVG